MSKTVPEAEQITVRVSGRNGLALINLDATRRLSELGYKRKGGKFVRSSPHSLTQQAFLEGYPLIRDLNHYRQLVSDERSQGPLVTYPPGATLLMTKAEHHKTKAAWYVVLDTAIGARPKFLEELVRRKTISIQ